MIIQPRAWLVAVGLGVLLWLSPAGLAGQETRQVRSSAASGSIPARAAEPQTDPGDSLYQYRQSADGGTTWDPAWTAVSAGPVTRALLINDTDYTFQVRAGNAVGYGPAAEATPRFEAPTDADSNKVDTSSPASRTARKLGIGALWGIVPSYALGLFLTLATGNTEGFGAGLLLEFTVLFGYPLGVAAGVDRVDRYDRFIHSLAGSVVGFAVGAKLTSPHNYLEDSRWETWPLYVCPLVGATIASELGRDSNESRRFSIHVVPRPGALSAVAKVRF